MRNTIRGADILTLRSEWREGIAPARNSGRKRRCDMTRNAFDAPRFKWLCEVQVHSVSSFKPSRTFCLQIAQTATIYTSAPIYSVREDTVFKEPAHNAESLVVPRQLTNGSIRRMGVRDCRPRSRQRGRSAIESLIPVDTPCLAACHRVPAARATSEHHRIPAPGRHTSRASLQMVYICTGWGE